MTERLVIPQLGLWNRLLGQGLRPAMRLAAGKAWREEPQGTLVFNQLKFLKLPDEFLNFLLTVEGDPTARSAYLLGIRRSHFPVLGGWTQYVVLQPKYYYRYGWHPGWSTSGGCGCSRVRADGPVRLLIGRDSTDFFGASAGYGEPITLEVAGYGSIGDGGRYCQLPLL